MYEGAPDYPGKDVWWEIVERYGVTILYTAPTAIRACMKWGPEHPESHDLTTLRLLGSVGEPINPKAWLWYHKVVGGERCPIVDTWWQTETGQIMISPLPGITATKPGSATLPLPGVEAAVFDDEGKPVEEQEGLLVLHRPWPGMLRTLYREEERFVETYFSRFGKETYLVGDAARRDEDGCFWVLGRIDDVINVSGHRLSTAEVESAIVSHPKVAEAAVIGARHPKWDERPLLIIVLKEGQSATRAEILAYLEGKIAKWWMPDDVVFVGAIPHTATGKIQKTALRDQFKDYVLPTAVAAE
jgi:acetyl-CoA synthetase